MAIYSNIRNLREDRDLSQKTLAEVLKVSRSSYSAYENGVNQFTPEHLIALADYYKTSVDYLLDLTDDPKPYPRKKKK